MRYLSDMVRGLEESLQLVFLIDGEVISRVSDFIERQNRLPRQIPSPGEV